jgi:uncharacterized protein HemX
MKQYAGELIVGALTALGTFYITRMRTKAETKSIEANTEMDSVERAIGIWRQLAEDLNDQITEQKQEFDQQIDLLKQQIADLQKENKRLHDIISKLQGASS